MKSCAVFLIVLCLVTPTVLSQTGGNTAVDGRLGVLGTSLANQGRSTTAYPSGYARMSMATTSCNPGSVNIPWLQAGNVTHPFIGFLIARVDTGGGRIVQISDRSYIKHGFFALSNNQCSPCACPTPGNGDWLGLACSDTYSTGNNASSLAPADDVNPWTGVWTPGAQPGGGSSNCPRMSDADLGMAGATYYYCAHYVFPSWTQLSNSTSGCTVGGNPVPQNPGSPLGFLCEPDANRNNNWASRLMLVTPASTPTLTSSGAQLDGTVLQRWSGATITSNTNGDPVVGPSDGRVYVAVRVTTALNGRYHYEYAVHNRDNKGGVGVFRVPSCPGTTVTNVGFHDVDVPASAANDWTFANNGSELTWTAPAGNSLRWNMLFNFWFDSDAQPVAGNLTLDQAAIVGGVSPSFTVGSSVPSGLFNVNLGPGCSLGTPPTLYAVGNPARASLGNATFALQSSGNGVGNTVYVFASLVSGTDPEFVPCNLYLGPDLSSAQLLTSGVASFFGSVTFAFPVPNDIALEGLTGDLQAVEVAAGGIISGAINLSNGLRVRVGSAISNCP